MMRDVKHNISDGLLGFGGTPGAGIHVKIGASLVTSKQPITILGSMKVDVIRQRLGLSPLADAAMDSVEQGASRIYCIPVAASTAGTLGKVVKEGTGTGTLTASGAPSNAFDIVVKITAAGMLNTAAYTVSINGGHTFSEEATIPTGGQCAIEGTGVTLTFAAATEGDAEASFQLGDVYNFSTTAPAMTNADVLAALEKLKHFEEVYEFVHLVGEAQSALWAAVSAFQLELQAQFKRPALFVLEAYRPNVDETMADYALRLEADRKKIRNYNIQVVAARGLYTRMDGTIQDVNLAGVVAGLYARTGVQTAIGKTSPSAQLGISKDKLLELRPAGVEDILETLDLAGYLTFRGYDGLENYYVYHAPVLSAEGSDFRFAEDVRVLNKIIRETRREGLLLLNDDIDLENVQGELEVRAKFLQVPLDKMVDAKEISSASVTPLDDQEAEILATGTVQFKVRYASRGYIREIIIDLGRKPPGGE